MWLTYELWKLRDFAALLVGVEPDEMNEFEKKILNKDPLFDYYSIGGIGAAHYIDHVLLKHKEYRKQLEILERSKLFQNPERQADRIDCINWAVENKIVMPAELNEYSNNISNIEDCENTKIKDLRAKLSGKSNSFNKLQKAFAALCKDQYNFDTDATAMGKLQGSINRGGYQLDNKTIREHFKDGLDKIKKSSK